MKRYALIALALGLASLALLIAAPNLGLHLEEDVRDLLLGLVSGFEGMAIGWMLPQAK